MACQGAKSVKQMFTDANRIAPKRKKASDGICASQQHHNTNPASDHEADNRGIAHAGDLTHDPANGWDAHKRARLTFGDPRIKYVISNGTITSYYAVGSYPAWKPRPYHGSNPHTKHAHVSIRYGAEFENDTRPWWPDGLEDDLSEVGDKILAELVKITAALVNNSKEIKELGANMGPDYGPIGKALYTKRVGPDGKPVLDANGKFIYDETTEIIRAQMSEHNNILGELADAVRNLTKEQP